MTKTAGQQLLDILPDVRGKITPDAPLSRHSWFRTGGPADVLFEPEDARDLIEFLGALPLEIPTVVLGVGSNLLVRDGGVEGVVIKLGKAFATIKTMDDHVLSGAGAMDVHVARAARDAGIANLEWLVGVPGTIGGAIRMNAGAYQGELSDSLVEVSAVDREGATHVLTNKDLDFSYRSCGVPNDYIFLTAALKGSLSKDFEAIGDKMRDIMTKREESQPIGSRTGGSTFKNPEGKKAWELIDKAGCRGLSVGGAMMSEKHCNFMINKENATASDVENLGELVRERVKEATGVSLEWEIKRVGRREVP